MGREHRKSIRLFLFFFAILPHNMPANRPDIPAPPPSPKDRREYYRITVTLPISIQPETDTAENPLTEKSINISGGGIGLTVHTHYQPNEILSLTVRLSDQVLFKAFIEVLRLTPIPYPTDTCRLHARFIRMTSQNRELLIRHILSFQRDHLNKHYSA
jgi:c-di-GMP-binding flagellar brake protein YcgR